MGKYLPLDEWIDNPNEFKCPYCGREDCRLSGFGGDMLGVKCSDHKCEGYGAGGGIVNFDYTELNETDSPITMDPPEKWVVGEVSEMQYQCPHCDSNRMDRKPMNDGMGYWDVMIECLDCSEHTWE